ncbi:MAG: lipoyl(octanoyl) transferase LipB [Limnospira maxima]|nr:MULTISPECIES: lipoyl(octanoyl) transferase LipB [unclassified Limnospira]MDT9207898.1 lipoyl(octanoyl) transferase LipB [Limnospira sp. PMC 1252.20]MDT9321181.1 lipoyl(octanoyl) transferase LipB [Limnospira sp. PMC 1290.21]
MPDDTPVAIVDTNEVYCQFYNLGLISYQQAWRWQQDLVADRINCPNLEDILILLEHPPVYTLGQGASSEFLKFDPHESEYELYRVERGGEVTYHCPGQLVGYPILNLRRYQMDLHWYLRQLEEVLIRTIRVWGIEAQRVEGLTGVWVGETKVAAIGIKVSRWITMHGFALNVCPDLTGFKAIVPCGISDFPVGSLAELVPDISIEQVRDVLAACFAEVFGVTLKLTREEKTPGTIAIT